MEEGARAKHKPFQHEPVGSRSLAELASLMAILEAAALAANAHSQRCAHLAAAGGSFSDAT